MKSQTSECLIVRHRPVSLHASSPRSSPKVGLCEAPGTAGPKDNGNGSGKCGVHIKVQVNGTGSANAAARHSPPSHSTGLSLFSPFASLALMTWQVL